MGLNRRQLRRLEEKAQLPSVTALQEEAWAREAMARLSTEDLEHIERATAPDREDTLLSPAERAAFERFELAFEEAKRGF